MKTTPQQRSQAPLRQLAIRWHRRLTWPALAALLLFVISGISHPLMVWTGPQAQQFFPPKIQYNSQHWNTLKKVAKQVSSDPVAILKLTPSQQGAVIQLTPNPLKPRRYFDANTGTELADYDKQQAQWLARYYSGEQQASIISSTLITEFNLQYPSVNRQLPVWKIDFQHNDNLSLYIHTETLTAAAINNDWKRSLQWLFQLLHTQSLFGDYPWLQFAIMNILMLTLIVFVSTGITMVWTMPKRKHIPSSKRRWHRRTAIALYVPLLLFLFSGFYHLWYSQLADSPSGQRLGKSIDLTSIANSKANILESVQGKSFNQLSIINHNDDLFLRASVANSQQNTITRQQRFKGKTKEYAAHYISLTSNTNEQPLTDKHFASLLAQQQFNQGETISQVSRISHFGNGYDFRNKRLPVWRVETNRQWYFVDTSTGILVEIVDMPRRYEGLSFSILHKWNLLVPAIGRLWRDVSIVSCLSLFLLLAFLGLAMKLKSSRR